MIFFASKMFSALRIIDNNILKRLRRVENLLQIKSKLVYGQVKHIKTKISFGHSE